LRHWLARLLVAAFYLSGCLGSLTVVRAQAVPGWHQVKRFDAAVTVAVSSSFDTGLLTVATATRGLFYSVDGQNFKPAPAFTANFDVKTLAYVAHRMVWAGTSDEGLWSSSDAGATWSRVSALPCTSVSSIYPDTANPGTVYVATLCSGTFVSSDLGVTFNTVPPSGSTVRATGVVRIDASTLAVATAADNIHISRDNGRTFVRVESPMRSVDWLVYQASCKALVAAGGSSIVVSTDSGKTWASRPVPGRLPVRGIAVGGSTLVAATTGGGIYGSRDAGLTWYAMNQGLQDRAMTSVTASGMSLVAASESGEVSRLDAAYPYVVVSPTEVDLGRLPQNRRLSFSIRIENLGGGTLEAVAGSLPGYVTSDRASVATDYRSSVTLTVDARDLLLRTHESVIRVTSNGGDAYVNVRFEVVTAAPVHLVMTIGLTSATIDGQTRNMEVAPFIDKQSDRTLVPVRFIAEALGAIVEWDAVEQRVSLATAGGPGGLPGLIDLYIGKRTARVNGQVFTIDVAPAIYAGRTFVPARFVSESLGAEVTWDAAKRQVTIDYSP
jgi:photosystem II stability/assembly factor-like uncharacterized protein